MVIECSKFLILSTELFCFSFPSHETMILFLFVTAQISYHQYEDIFIYFENNKYMCFTCLIIQYVASRILQLILVYLMNLYPLNTKHSKYWYSTKMCLFGCSYREIFFWCNKEPSYFYYLSVPFVTR